MGRGFASDNWSGVCPEIMRALNDVNEGHIFAYGEGNEEISATSREIFKKYFGDDIEIFFVYNGTAANVLSIKHIIQSYQAIITANTAHLTEDECGAPEKFIGSKILEVNSTDGKITPEQVEPFMNSIGFQHHSQPKIISISQVTEMGTVYSPQEIRTLADYAHANNMYLHMDGARISNAAVSLGSDFKSFTTDVGVDILSFGGTKNGLMFGEVVIFFNKELANDFEYTRKQGMQLHSKMRFIAAQFTQYLTNDLWRKNAQIANDKAKELAKKISNIKHLKVSQDTQANGVFVMIPVGIIPILQNEYFFHVWNETPQLINDVEYKEVRLMCSWDTTDGDINGFIDLTKKILEKNGI